MTAEAPRRPDDIVSSIDDSSLPNKVPAAQARAAGRFGHEKPTAENSIMLFIDHQIGLLVSTRDFGSAAEIKSNVVGLARVAKALEIPVLITSSNAQWQNGDSAQQLEHLGFLHMTLQDNLDSGYGSTAKFLTA
jgi:hypothetical protein